MNVAAPASVADLLDLLASLGVHFWRDGNQLGYRAPRDALSEEMKAHIRERKPQILDYLAVTEVSRARPLTPNIVPLHAGDRQRPVFCVHAVDGGVGAYLELSARLSACTAVYGVTAFDFEARRTDPLHVEAMAGTYADQVQALQPHGPYFLVGWCVGGRIAFEMARVLADRGEPIGGLFLLDSAAPSSADGRAVAPPDTTALWERFLSLHVSTRNPAIPPSFWTDDDRGKAAYLLANARDKEQFLPRNALLAARDINDILYMFEVANQQFAAPWAPSSGAYSGRLDCFVIGDRTDPTFCAAAEQSLAFWASLTTGDVHTVWLEGTHSAALREPGVALLADGIQRLLGAAAPP